eukprot:5074137-Pleurochrysis_carterae.AAC.1
MAKRGSVDRLPPRWLSKVGRAPNAADLSQPVGRVPVRTHHRVATAMQLAMQIGWTFSSASSWRSVLRLSPRRETTM